MGTANASDSALDMYIAVLVMGQEPGQEAIPAYSRDIAAAWQVKERIQHLSYAGDDDLRRTASIASTFDDLLAEINLLDLPAPEAAAYICQAALVALQEGAADA